MGYIMAISLFVIWMFEREASLLIASGLFYIGASIGACAGNLCKDNKEQQN